MGHLLVFRYRGTMAILSSIGLNLLVSAALYRPFIASKHTKRTSLTINYSNTSTEVTCKDLSHPILKHYSKQAQSYSDLNARSDVSDIIIPDKDCCHPMLSNSNAETQSYSSSNKISDGISMVQEDAHCCHPLTKHSSSEITSYNALKTRSDDIVDDTCCVFNNRAFINSDENLSGYKDNIDFLSKFSDSTLTNNIAGKMSAKELYQETNNSPSDSNHSNLNSQHKLDGGCSSFNMYFKNIHAVLCANECVQSMVNLSFVTFELSACLLAGTIFACPTLLVAHAKIGGMDESSAVYLLAFLGVADVLGSIIGGLMYDHALVLSMRINIYIIALLLFGIAVIAYGFCVTFLSFAINTVCVGFFIGAISTGIPIFTTDLVGMEYRSLAFGQTLFCEGIGALIAPMTAGMIYEEWRRYYYLSYFLMFLVRITGMIYLLRFSADTIMSINKDSIKIKVVQYLAKGNQG